MKPYLLCVLLVLCYEAVPRVASLNTDQDSFLIDVTCKEAQDCYIRDGELALACYYNVNKCKCQNTYHSIYNLQVINNQCVMSKFGPCGKNGEAEVGCSDGFECIQGKCLDPQNPSKANNGPFEFQTGSCDSCQFSDDLRLQCEGRDLGAGKEKCVCEKVYVADKRGTVWDLRNYDGDKNCSVGQFGPCGERNGVLIECHGVGISCVQGICINPNHPKSALNEPCEKEENCEQNLICSASNKCIQPQTTPAGESCRKDIECSQGLQCKRDPKLGPWSGRRCQ